MLFSLLCIIVLPVFYILWYLLKLALWAIHAAEMTSNIPGPKPWPILGNSLLFSDIKNSEDSLAIMYSLPKKYCNSDRILKVWMGPKLIIALGNPKHIASFLSSRHALDKDSFYEHIGIFANRGLFFQNGHKWQELRKPLVKILNKNRIESNLSIFHEKSYQVCKQWSKSADNGELVNLRHLIINYSVDTVSVTNFGYDMNEVENDKTKVAKTYEIVADILFNMAVQFPYNLSVTYTKLSALGRKAIKLGQVGLDLCSELIDKSIDMRKHEDSEISGKNKTLYYSDVIMSIAKRDNLNRQQIAQSTLDILVASFDTISVIVSSVLQILAMYPEHQEAVYREQVQLVGDDPNVAPTWEQISKMNYLDRVLKEVMRLNCSPGVLRVLSEDLDLGDYKLPKGCTLFLMLHSLHRDPEFWSHPNEFYPDHFLPEESLSRPKTAYLPFLQGLRSCPGKLYGNISNKILISTAVRMFKFQTDLKFEQIKYKYSFLLESVQGYHVRISRRKISR